MKTFYTAKATAEGGRSGSVKTDDGKIDMNLSVPKDMGGDGGEGTNPEQFFASAYSACYGSALQSIAEDLVNKAHEVCPFSRATRDNIDVTLNLLLEE